MNINMMLNAIKTIAPETKVDVHMVQKGNALLTGIIIGNGSVRPTVYMEHYEDIFDGCNYSEVAVAMLKTISECNTPSFDLDSMLSWNYAQTHLKLCIAPKDTNDDYITYPYLDLEMYIRVIVSQEENETGSYKVSEQFLQKWGITRKTLFYAALVCTKPTYRKFSIGEVLYGTQDNSMIAIQAEDNLYGASALYCKDILKEIADQMDSDLIIIPSSIHEIICVSTNTIDEEYATEMVQEVNEEYLVLKPEEVLSDHVYVFHRDTMEITF